MGGMVDAQPTLVMSFPTLDEAESALDWIGVDFVDAEGGFNGELAADDRELLAAALDDPDTPDPVRDLARALLRLLDTADADAMRDWRVAFEA
jgi:hypothetical protein